VGLNITLSAHPTPGLFSVWVGGVEKDDIVQVLLDNEPVTLNTYKHIVQSSCVDTVSQYSEEMHLVYPDDKILTVLNIGCKDRLKVKVTTKGGYHRVFSIGQMILPGWPRQYDLKHEFNVSDEFGGKVKEQHEITLIAHNKVNECSIMVQFVPFCEKSVILTDLMK